MSHKKENESNDFVTMFNNEMNYDDNVTSPYVVEEEKKDEIETSVYNDIRDDDDSDAFSDYDSYDLDSPYQNPREIVSVYEKRYQNRTLIVTWVVICLFIALGVIYYFTTGYFKLSAKENTYGPISFESTQQFQTENNISNNVDGLLSQDTILNSGKIQIRIVTTKLTEATLQNLQDIQFGAQNTSPNELGLIDGRSNYQGNVRYFGGLEFSGESDDRASYSILDINNGTEYNISIIGGKTQASEIKNIYQSLKFDGKSIIDYH